MNSERYLWPRAARNLLLAGLAAAVVIIGLTWSEIHSTRERTLNEAGEELAQIGLSLSAQLERDLQAVALVMTEARELALRQGGPRTDLHRQLYAPLRNLSSGLPILNNLLIINNQGLVVASNLNHDQPLVDVSDRPYFKYHRASPQGELTLGESVISRTTGYRVLQVTQRITGPRGEFLGIVLGTLRHDYLAGMFRTFVPSAEGAAVLLRRDGRLLARYPLPAESAFAEDFHTSGLFTRLLLNSPIGLLGEEPTALDDKARLGAYRVVGEWPAVLVVSQTEAQILAPWRELAWQRTLMAAASLVALIWLISRVVRQIFQLESNARALMASESRFRTLFDSVADPIFLVHPADGSVVGLNDEAAVFIGRTPENMTGRNLSEVLVEPSCDDLHPILQGVHSARGHTLEGMMRAYNGRLVPVEVRLSRIEQGSEPLLMALAIDISERKATHAELERMANYDELTRLPKRALFFDRLYQALAMARRMGRMVGVLFVDLDHFKEVNDDLGHAAGDDLLRQAAVRMEEALRQVDTVARYGGDEFVILLPEIANREDVAQVADKLCQAFRQPFLLDGKTATISTSIGLAIYPRDGEDAELLLRHADQAMYEAKAGGRDRVCQYRAPTGGNGQACG